MKQDQGQLWKRELRGKVRMTQRQFINVEIKIQNKNYVKPSKKKTDSSLQKQFSAFPISDLLS